MPQVIIVSNRLPISVKKEDGELSFSRSVGGVATGLASFIKSRRSSWIGWPGVASDDLTDADKKKITAELRKQNCIPVFLTKKQIDDFYNGYSNSLLWPLFHNMKQAHASDEEHRRWWNAYRSVNQAFAEAVLEVATDTSQIWVHDYQLMLVCDEIRKERENASIGFFLHIPFPEPHTFAKIPEYKKLLNGMLGANLIGFHTPSYVQNFLANCLAYTNATVGVDQVTLSDRSIRVANFPMGIDYEKYAASGKTKAVKEAVRKYRKRYRGLRVIVAVDRMDPTKGLVERLQAYRDLLEANPKLRGKVVFSVVASPSRTEVTAYKNLKKKLDVLAAEINETYGTKKWQPLDYMPETKPFEEVTALFQIADVAFIAPLKDGMNLAAKEYVASRRKNGVLILSETAGAAEELRDALIVNPRRPGSSVEALQAALTMPKRELRKRLKTMQNQIATNTVHTWAGSFVKALQQPLPAPTPLVRPLTGRAEKHLVRDYRASKKRLLLLDYDGSLIRIAERPSRAEPPKTLLTQLKKLSEDPANTVVVISGRSADDLEAKLGTLPIHLVAEHGGWIKKAGDCKWTSHISTGGSDWQSAILPILEQYASLTPKATVEVKDHTLVWHYRESPPYYAQKYAVVLKRALKPLLRKYGLELFQGKKILEIKDPHLNKGRAIKQWLAHKHDFILIVGDDYTDETMFSVAPQYAFTLKVGRGRTLARFRVADEKRIRDILKQFI